MESSSLSRLPGAWPDGGRVYRAMVSERLRMRKVRPATVHRREYHRDHEDTHPRRYGRWSLVPRGRPVAVAGGPRRAHGDGAGPRGRTNVGDRGRHDAVGE